MTDDPAELLVAVRPAEPADGPAVPIFEQPFNHLRGPPLSPEGIEISLPNVWSGKLRKFVSVPGQSFLPPPSPPIQAGAPSTFNRFGLPPVPGVKSGPAKGTAAEHCSAQNPLLRSRPGTSSRRRRPVKVTLSILPAKLSSPFSSRPPKVADQK